MGILSAAESLVLYTVHTIKVYIPYQIVFSRDMIIPIKHIVNWKSIRQRNQTQINYDNVSKNTSRLEHVEIFPVTRWWAFQTLDRRQ